MIIFMGAPALLESKSIVIVSAAVALLSVSKLIGVPTLLESKVSGIGSGGVFVLAVAAARISSIVQTRA